MTPEDEIRQLEDEIIEVKLVLKNIRKDRDQWRDWCTQKDKTILRLQEQVHQFRTLCDPYELKVLVTPDELAG